MKRRGNLRRERDSDIPGVGVAGEAFIYNFKIQYRTYSQRSKELKHVTNEMQM